jgi:transcriptional regulator with XRE-family HTH domain
MIFLVKGNPTISRRLRAAVKTAEVRQYRLAEAIGVDHSRLSAWLNGIARVRRGDPRIVKLGSLVGVPARACFAPLASRVSRVGRQGQGAGHRHARQGRDPQPMVRRGRRRA